MFLHLLISVAITLACMAFMFWMAFNEPDAELAAVGEGADEGRVPGSSQPTLEMAA